jgi:hypothetical protein
MNSERQSPHLRMSAALRTHHPSVARSGLNTGLKVHRERICCRAAKKHQPLKQDAAPAFD